MVKELVFENRAWVKAEHPKYVSEHLRISDNEKRFLKSRTINVERKYFVETYETRIRTNGIKETYASWKCFNYIEKIYKVKAIRK